MGHTRTRSVRVPNPFSDPTPDSCVSALSFP